MAWQRRMLVGVCPYVNEMKGCSMAVVHLIAGADAAASAVAAVAAGVVTPDCASHDDSLVNCVNVHITVFDLSSLFDCCDGRAFKR